MTTESLPPLKSSDGPLELADHLADDVDGLGLEGVELAQPTVLAGPVGWCVRCRVGPTRRDRPGCRGVHGVSCVDPAFGLGEAGPAAGAGVLAGRDPAGARRAADGRVAVGEERG